MPQTKKTTQGTAFARSVDDTRGFNCSPWKPRPKPSLSVIDRLPSIHIPQTEALHFSPQAREPKASYRHAKAGDPLRLHIRGCGDHKDTGVQRRKRSESIPEMGLLLMPFSLEQFKPPVLFVIVRLSHGRVPFGSIRVA